MQDKFLNVSPTCPSNDHGNVGSRNSVFLGDDSMWALALPDLNNLRCGQFGTPLGLSSWRVASPLYHLVAIIVGLAAQEQVIRADAWRVVAAVADTHSVWNRSVGEDPCETVGLYGSVVHLEGSVAAASLPTDPNPASVALMNERLKSFIDRHSDMLFSSHDDLPGRCGQGPAGIHPGAVPILAPTTLRSRL